MAELLTFTLCVFYHNRNLTHSRTLSGEALLATARSPENKETQGLERRGWARPTRIHVELEGSRGASKEDAESKPSRRRRGARPAPAARVLRQRTAAAGIYAWSGVFFSEKSSQTWVLSGVLTGLNVFWLKRGAVPVAWQWEVLSNEGKSQAGTLEIILKCIGPLSHDIANRTRSLLFNLVFITRGYHRATEMWIWSPGHLTGLDPL